MLKTAILRFLNCTEVLLFIGLSHYSDYYPFGMLVPSRHGKSEDYRYGFQRQEKDDEIKGGEGNSMNYTFRMHDPRIGRFFAIDPLTFKYPWYTPYSFSGNKVIQFVELEGLEESGTNAGSIFMSLLFPLPPNVKKNPRRYPGSHGLNLAGKAAGATLSLPPLIGGTVAGATPVLETMFWTTAVHISEYQLLYISAGNFFVGALDESGTIDTPGPLDDAGRDTRLVIGTMLKSEFTKKFTVVIGKLNFGLGKGSTVEKDLAKVTMQEITNMAKSLIRSNKLKEQGIDTSEKLLGLTSKALNEGVEVSSRVTQYGEEFTKQIRLDDGTKVNVNFIIREKGGIPDVSSYSLPEINSSQLGSKIKELKDKAIKAGNEIIN